MISIPSSDQPSRYADGAAYLDGAFLPIADARIPVVDPGYRRADATYDVVSVWDGNFFRLDDHIRRFRRSMTRLRMDPPEDDESIKSILNTLVALTGNRASYVSMECVRGGPPPGKLRHPINGRCYLSCHAVGWLSVASPEMLERGMHLVVSRFQRISPASVDPTVKNFHWGDLTQSMFEAHDLGADYGVLLDNDGFVTEGAGFNIFCILNGIVLSPRKGALEGVTRQSVFELCKELELPLEVRDITVDELRASEEIFTSTTAGGIMPVSRLDGRIMNNDRPGPLSTKIKDLFWKKREDGWYATPVDYNAVRR